MTAFASDNFNGVNGTTLHSHLDLLGNTWTAIGSRPSTVEIQSNTGKPLGAHCYYNSGAPGTANYTVSTTVQMLTTGGVVIGPAIRMVSSGDTYYHLEVSSNGVTYAIKKRVSDVGTVLQTLTSTAWAVDTYLLQITALGSSTTVLTAVVQRSSDGFYLQTDGTFGASAVNCMSVNDSSSPITAAGFAGIRGGLAAGNTTLAHYTIFSADPVSVPSTAVKITGPLNGTVNTASTNFTVQLDPPGTTTGNDTVTPNDGGAGGTFNPASVILSTNIQTANFTYTPTTIGARTISLTDTLGLSMPAGFTYTSLDNVIINPTTDTFLYASPTCWRRNSNVSVIANANQAFVKGTWTGTSLKTTIDVSTFVAASVASIDYPSITWTTDWNNEQSHQLTSSDGVITLATGVSAGSHSIYLSYNVPDYNPAYEVWNNPTYILAIQNFILDNGGSFITPVNEVALKPNKTLFLGDSITAGRGRDVVGHWCQGFAAGLNSEPIIRGFSAIGWEKSGVSPPLPTEYTLYDAQNSMLVGGKLPESYNHVVILCGQNDITMSSSTVTNFLVDLRSKVDTTTWIFVYVPFSRNNAATIGAGVTAYQSAHPTDRLVRFLDPGTWFQYGLNSSPPPPTGSTRASQDNKHPRDQYMSLIAARMGFLAGQEIANGFSITGVSIAL